MVEFRILKGGGKAKTKITAVDLRRADFGIFRDLLRRIPWETVLESRVVQERPVILRYHLPTKLKSGLPASRKSSKGSRRPTWMNKELLTKL